MGDIGARPHQRLWGQLSHKGREVGPGRREAVRVVGVIAGRALGETATAGAVVIPPGQREADVGEKYNGD